jgi:hypothetical protein
MASSLLQSRPGAIHLLTARTGLTVGTLLTWPDGGPGGKESGERVASPIVINNVGYSQGLNIQFMSTLKKFVYVYSFGDRMGELRVGGIAFDNNCDGGESGWGTRSVLEYYRDNRAIKDNQKVSIVVAGETVTGFLTNMEMSLADAEFKTMAFNLVIKTLPKDAIVPKASSNARALERFNRLANSGNLRIASLKPTLSFEHTGDFQANSIVTT